MQGSEISEIATEINTRMQSSFKTPQRIQAVLLSLDIESRTIQVWNGSGSAVLLLDVANKLALHSFVSDHEPLGALSHDKFSNSVETHVLGNEAGIILMGAGVANEAENIDVSSVNLSALLERAGRVGGNMELFQSVLTVLRNTGADEITALISVDCPTFVV